MRDSSAGMRCRVLPPQQVKNMVEPQYSIPNGMLKPSIPPTASLSLYPPSRGPRGSQFGALSHPFHPFMANPWRRVWNSPLELYLPSVTRLLSISPPQSMSYNVQ